MQHKIRDNITLSRVKHTMAHGNFPFHFGGDFYSSRSDFEDPDQRPMQPYYHPYSLTPSQVQHGPNGLDFWGSSQSSSMSGSASANPSQGSSQTSSSESPTDLDEAPGRKVYDKWTEEQETFLIDLWAEYDNELESAQSRKYWVKIQERLNKRFKSSWSVSQIQRKIRYLKEQFKKANDWNRRQTGGNRKSSPYFNKINEIIGKKDSVTMKHIVSAGNPSPTNQDDQESSKPENCGEEKDDGDDEDIKAKGKAAKHTRRERKLKRKNLKRPLEQSLDDEEEKERAKTFNKRMESMENQGAKMADTMQSIVTSMQAAQAQQAQFMGEFMKLFAGMANQAQQKD